MLQTEYQPKLNNLLISTGKTGGHIFPAILVTEKYLEINPSSKVFIVCFNKDIFTKSLKNNNVIFIVLNDWSGKNLKRIIYNTLKIIREISKNKIKKVLIFGSYLAIPVIMASILKGINLFLHEQNVLPGKANRIAQIYAKKIFLTYRNSVNYLLPFVRKKIIITGCPTRKSNNSKNSISNNSVLVMGGSQGAESINNFIINNISKIEKGNHKFILITGVKNFESFNRRLRVKPGNLEVISFTDDIINLMSKSKIIISRAGAITLSEISSLGKPSILIPFPYASENHQEINAKYFLSNNASILLKDSELVKKNTFQLIEDLINDKDKLTKMGNNALKLHKPKAEEKIVRSTC